MLKKFRKLFGDVVVEDSFAPGETEDEETEDDRFETPPMDEYLQEKRKSNCRRIVGSGFLRFATPC